MFIMTHQKTLKQPQRTSKMAGWMRKMSERGLTTTQPAIRISKSCKTARAVVNQSSTITVSVPAPAADAAAVLYLPAPLLAVPPLHSDAPCGSTLSNPSLQHPTPIRPTLWLHSPQPQGEMTILDCFSRPTYSWYSSRSPCEAFTSCEGVGLVQLQSGKKEAGPRTRGTPGARPEKCKLKIARIGHRTVA